MLKKLSVLTLMALLLLGCSPDETADLPPAQATSNATANPVEEPVIPEETIVPPAGGVDLEDLPAEEDPDGDGDISQPEPGIPNPEVHMIQLAGEHLARRLGVAIGEITLVEAVDQEWPDAGLGCPSPDQLYAAVITPGFQITLEAQGDPYIYHTDAVETVVLCVDGRPAEEV